MSQTTRMALAASLKKLLEEKPLEKISIRDITEDSEVNRQTFYYHYRDIYDLIEWVFINEGGKVLREHNSYESFQEGFLSIFYYLEGNKRLVLSTFHSIGREQLERFLFGEVYKLLSGLVNDEIIGESISDANKAFIIDFYKYALAGTMFQWIRTDMQEDPKIIANNISRLITGDIPPLLLKHKES